LDPLNAKPNLISTLSMAYQYPATRRPNPQPLSSTRPQRLPSLIEWRPHRLLVPWSSAVPLMHWRQAAFSSSTFCRRSSSFPSQSLIAHAKARFGMHGFAEAWFSLARQACDPPKTRLLTRHPMLRSGANDPATHLVGSLTDPSQAYKTQNDNEPECHLGTFKLLNEKSGLTGVLLSV
jgi:hypothetical protein